MASWDWGGAAGGYFGGGLGGAQIGTMLLPGIGTAIGAGVGAIGGGLMGSGIFNKKKSRDVPDPLAGLRAQLQALAGQVPAQVAKQKELTAAKVGQYKTEGMQNIGENIRAERGFGNTSLQDELNRKLIADLTEKQSAADLASDIWGTQEQANILKSTAGMYPSETELPEEENWVANLLGVGAQMAAQNWMQENQWKNLKKNFPNAFGGGETFPKMIDDWQEVGTKGTPGWRYSKLG